MPETALPIVTITGLNAAASNLLTWTAADVVNGNAYGCTGRELVLVRNVSGVTAADVTVTSVADRLGRSGNFVEEVAPGQTRVLMRGIDGWRQPDRTVLLSGETVDIQFVVIRLPIS